MTPEPPDDDKCQISMCNQTHFTYCPHCKLFVCIEHLNEHYASYRQEYHNLLNQGKQQQIINKNFLFNIESEKEFFTKFFHREIQYFQSHEKYIQEKSIQTSIRPQDCSTLRSHVVQSTEKRTKLNEILRKIHQIVENYQIELPNEPIVNGKNENRNTSIRFFSLFSFLFTEPPVVLAKVKKEEPILPSKSEKLILKQIQFTFVLRFSSEIFASGSIFDRL